MPDTEPTYFVTNDNRMRDGVMDPDDIAIVRDMVVITAEEALELSRIEESANGDGHGSGEEDETPLPEGAIQLTPEQMEEMARHAGETLKAFEALAEAIVTRMDLGAFIRRERVDRRKSWRAVSRAVHDEIVRTRNLPDPVWEPVTNQLMGMTLCRVAAEVADQDYMQPPWN